MSYLIRRGGNPGYKSYLTTSAFESIDDPENPDPDKRKWTDDRRDPPDWTKFDDAHVFEDENDAHAWVRKHDGSEGQLSVIDAEGERIEDPRGGFDSAVKRYIDTTGADYPGQSDWRRG